MVLPFFPVESFVMLFFDVNMMKDEWLCWRCICIFALNYIYVGIWGVVVIVIVGG
jgi:hypothetical protein